MNPEVTRTDLEFRVQGLHSPAEITNTPVPANTCAVVFDVVRSTTTNIAALASGVGLLQIVPKSATPQADDTPLRPMVPLVCGGEFGGMPIPGGVFGNSALDVPISLAGRDVRFFSSNSGVAVTRMADLLKQATNCCLLIGCLLNIDTLAKTIAAGDFDRLVVVCGGFYNRLSIEDAVAGGRLIQRLGIQEEGWDDGAVAMCALADRYRNDEALIEAVRGNRVGRTLRRFGRGRDIPAAIAGVGIDPVLAASMRQTVGRLTWLDENTPVFERITHTTEGNRSEQHRQGRELLRRAQQP